MEITELLPFTQAALERFAPAALNATDEVYRQLSGFADDSRRGVLSLLGAGAAELLADAGTETLALRLLCLDVFYRAIPHLDLVLTGSGFGVVSNANVAPASAQRVESLREVVRRERDDSRDVLVELLTGTEWASSPEAEAEVRCVFFTAMQMRRHGIRTDEGRPVYAAEFDSLQAALAAAEEYVCGICGHGLYAALVGRLRTGKAEGAYALAVEGVRRLMAALVQDRFATSVRPLSRALLSTLERYKAELPEYTGGRVYEAHHYKRYENKKEDGTFFFS